MKKSNDRCIAMTVNVDELRKVYTDSALKYCVDFFWKQDEYKYWSSVTYGEREG